MYLEGLWYVFFDDVMLVECFDEVVLIGKARDQCFLCEIEFSYFFVDYSLEVPIELMDEDGLAFGVVDDLILDESEFIGSDEPL